MIGKNLEFQDLVWKEKCRNIYMDLISYLMFGLVAEFVKLLDLFI